MKLVQSFMFNPNLGGGGPIEPTLFERHIAQQSIMYKTLETSANPHKTYKDSYVKIHFSSKAPHLELFHVF